MIVNMLKNLQDKMNIFNEEMRNFWREWKLRTEWKS